MCISCDINKAAVCILVALALTVAGIFFSATGYELMTAMEETTVPRIIVFDPGHGGEDGGAVSKNGTGESRLNLDVALKCSALADFAGIDSVLTRDSETLEYPDSCGTVAARKAYDTRRRAELVNETENSILISIHQNCYTHGAPRGPQVFFGSELGSRELAELIQGELNAQLFPENRRLAAAVSKDVYILNHVDRPALLVECGFISNPEEEKLLNSDAYRTKLAVIIAGCCMKFTEEINCEA